MRPSRIIRTRSWGPRRARRRARGPRTRTASVSACLTLAPFRRYKLCIGVYLTTGGSTWNDCGSSPTSPRCSWSATTSRSCGCTRRPATCRRCTSTRMRARRFYVLEGSLDALGRRRADRSRSAPASRHSRRHGIPHTYRAATRTRSSLVIATPSVVRVDSCAPRAEPAERPATLPVARLARPDRSNASRAHRRAEHDDHDLVGPPGMLSVSSRLGGGDRFRHPAPIRSTPRSTSLTAARLREHGKAEQRPGPTTLR